MTVGRIVKVVHDLSRREIYNQQHHRSFPVSIYYPSVTPYEERHVSTLLSLFHPAISEARNVFSSMGIDSEILTSVVTPVANNALPQFTSPLPVLIFSPGFGIDRDLYVEVITSIVNSGYVVVAIGAPYDSFLTVYPDGKVILQADRHPSDFEQIETRTQDIRYVMGHLSEWNREDCLNGLLDINRISMMGHSLGGAATFNVTATDERVRCLVLLDASLHLIGKGVPCIPVLNIRQEASSYEQYLDATRDEEDESKTCEAIAKAYIDNQTWLYDHLPPNRSFVKVMGANHLSFSTVSRLIGDAGPRVTLAIERVVGSFLDEFLKTKHGAYTEFILGTGKSPHIVTIDGAGLPVEP